MSKLKEYLDTRFNVENESIGYCFIDGSCDRNPGTYSGSGIIFPKDEFSWYGLACHIDKNKNNFDITSATNNVGELFAMHAALIYCGTNHSQTSVIFTDSIYVWQNLQRLDNWYESGSIEGKANRKIWDSCKASIDERRKSIKEELDRDIRMQFVKMRENEDFVRVEDMEADYIFVHINSHQNYKWNDKADEFAKKGVKNENTHLRIYELPGKESVEEFTKSSRLHDKILEYLEHKYPGFDNESAATQLIEIIDASK